MGHIEMYSWLYSWIPGWIELHCRMMTRWMKSPCTSTFFTWSMKNATKNDSTMWPTLPWRTETLMGPSSSRTSQVAARTMKSWRPHFCTPAENPSCSETSAAWYIESSTTVCTRLATAMIRQICTQETQAEPMQL